MGTQLPPHGKVHGPHFSAHVYCGHTVPISATAELFLVLLKQILEENFIFTYMQNPRTFSYFYWITRTKYFYQHSSMDINSIWLYEKSTDIRISWIYARTQKYGWNAAVFGWYSAQLRIN